MTLAHALHRLSLSKQHQDFWGVQLEHAIEEYNHAHIRDQQQASLGSRKVYYELDQFHRSLSRKPKPSTIIRNWERLDESGTEFDRDEFDLEALLALISRNSSSVLKKSTWLVTVISWLVRRRCTQPHVRTLALKLTSQKKVSK